MSDVIDFVSCVYWLEVEIVYWFYWKCSYYKLNGFRFLLFLYFIDLKDFNLKMELMNIVCVIEIENKIGLGGVKSGCKFL